MYSEPLCQVARSCVDVGSFHTLLMVRFRFFLQRQSGIFWIVLCISCFSIITDCTPNGHVTRFVGVTKENKANGL
jgi:hypothetical protein